jgi:hypothetical protein
MRLSVVSNYHKPILSTKAEMNEPSPNEVLASLASTTPWNEHAIVTCGTSVHTKNKQGKNTAPDDNTSSASEKISEFVMEFHREWSPHGYDKAVLLFERGYYDQSHFFRVVPNFLVQFGITYQHGSILHLGHVRCSTSFFLVINRSRHFLYFTLWS